MTSDPTDLSWDHVPGNLLRIRDQIREHAERAGRDPEEIDLIAVSKTVPVAAIRAALAAGQRHFGENRVQEGLPKIAALQDSGARFHMIGHLQTNKAKLATAFDMIESVDSERVATALNRHAKARLPVLLEVNIAGEASKFGIAPADVSAVVDAVKGLPNLEVQGLMTVAPLVADPEEVRPVFRALRQLGGACELDTLSMGMTNDFRVAIAEGATIVRIGRAIFGDR